MVTSARPAAPDPPPVAPVRGCGFQRQGRRASAKLREYVSLRSTAAAVGSVPGGAESADPNPLRDDARGAESGRTRGVTFPVLLGVEARPLAADDSTAAPATAPAAALASGVVIDVPRRLVWNLGGGRVYS